MRTAGLEGADKLIKQLSCIAPLVTGVLAVEPAQFTHDKLRIELSHTFAKETLRDEALEGALGHHEAYFILSSYPVWVGSVIDTIVGYRHNQRLNEVREARTINRVEAEGLLVDSELETTVRVIDEAIIHQSMLSFL